MADILTGAYTWLLALHLISVMFWMAGMYYLPRLFVYHAEAMENNEPVGNNKNRQPVVWPRHSR